MAVSGLHLGVISGFFLFIMKRLNIKDKAAFIITIAIIVYYCALCGFSKSVVRAGIMVGVLMIGKLLNRHSDSLNSLGIATFIICINPFAVWDVGAMLSVLSVLAICTLYPTAERKIGKLKPFKSYYINTALRYVLKNMALISCIILYQLPALIIFFGSTSLTGIISSVILVPLGSLATILALLTNLAIRIHIGLPFVLITRFINKAIIFLVEKLASLRLLVINFENYFVLVIAIILIILAICFIINKKAIKKAAVLSLCIIIISLISMAVINNSASYAYITKNGALAIYSKNHTVVYGVNTKSDYFAVKSFLSSRSRKIDCIFVNSQSPYSDMPGESFDCEKTVYRTYSQSLSDDFSIDYKTNRGTYDFTAKIGNIKLNENNSFIYDNDINITDNICTDKNGTINLDNGDIIYRISKNNYKARRVSVWQE
jgi:competence protein ComEC